MESQLLQGKVAIVTGSSYGMGRSIAELFAEEGAAVVLTAHGREKLDIAVRELADKGYRVAGVCADVRSYEDTQRVFATAIEKFGDLDILVNNAGIGDMILIDETTDESVANVMNVNFNILKYQPIHYTLNLGMLSKSSKKAPARGPTHAGRKGSDRQSAAEF